MQAEGFIFISGGILTLIFQYFFYSRTIRLSSRKKKNLLVLKNCNDYSSINTCMMNYGFIGLFSVCGIIPIILGDKEAIINMGIPSIVITSLLVSLHRYFNLKIEEDLKLMEDTFHIKRLDK